MPETHFQPQSYEIEEHRRTKMCAHLFLAYAVVPEARQNGRVTRYCEESLGVTSVYALAVNELWDDPRVEYGVYGFELKPGKVTLTETEQKFVEFVRMVADRFTELSDATKPVVRDIEQRL